MSPGGDDWRERMHEHAHRVLVRRLRFALLGCLGPIALFALADLYLSPGDLVPLWGIKAGGLGVLVLALLGLRRARGQGSVVMIALVSAAAMYALSTASAIYGEEPLTNSLLSITVALAAATLLPWGVAPQLALVGIAIAATVVTIHESTGSFAGVIAYPNVGVAIGLGVSVYIAYELQHGREALALRGAEQRRAEAQVRQLNEQLEGRVAERTAELERVNRELAHQVAVRAQAEAELTALIESANDAIWSVDREYRLIAFNSVMSERFARMFGFELQPGLAFDERVPQAWRDAWKGLYDRALAGERFSVEEDDVQVPEGTRSFLTYFNPIVTDGTITGLTVFSTDITERKNAEAAARRHQAELTHVLRLGTMGEMAAGLAHEINQPLGAIASYAQGSTRRLRGPSPDIPGVLGAIEQITAEALRAGEIIRRLRTLVRKEAPRQDWIDLNEIVRNVLQLLRPDALLHRIALRAELDRALPRVVGDGIQVEQVVVNLVRNGIEALSASAEPRELSVSTAADGDSVHAIVSDTGAGLNPDLRERIFDPFFSTKSDGLGMGLSISRTIVESHGGRLWTVPSPRGATFQFTLPINPEPAARAVGAS